MEGDSLGLTEADKLIDGETDSEGDIEAEKEMLKLTDAEGETDRLTDGLPRKSN